ncbi:ANR family transcriptional regulator [Escherichia coli]|uniref:ANR family transcriptional regulator n=1 Tax=Escherichia coli TaxID=562 RepID=UPI0034D97D5B
MREKKYDLAAQCWEIALQYAEKNEDIEWTIRRRDFCFKQDKVQNQSLRNRIFFNNLNARIFLL